jgi:hypothetical protein
VSIADFPITEDSSAPLRQFAVFTVSGREYQGIVLCDPATGEPMLVDTSGQAISGPRKGTKTVTAIAPTGAADPVLAANTSRISALIQNVGSVNVYLGKDNTVTSSTGILLIAGASMEDTESTDAWWAIVASGTGDLRVIETA